jgi:hypothetical protein
MISTLNEVEEAVELSHFTKSLITAREIAHDVSPQIGQELKDRWIIQRLMRIVERKRKEWATPPKEDKQLTLPGLEGLPRRIFLRNGRRKLLDKATIGQVRQNLEMLKARLSQKFSEDLETLQAKFSAHPKIKQMEAVIALMEKYVEIHPKITWEEVKKLEKERGSII